MTTGAPLEESNPPRGVVYLTPTNSSLTSLVEPMSLSKQIEEHAPIDSIAARIAADFYPRLDPLDVERALDELAEPLYARLQKITEPRYRASALTGHVYGALGFRGDEDRYYDPQNSFIHRVIERRRGIPITLAVVLMAVGRRVGIEVDGVGFPGHFLARVGGADGYLVDPFYRGNFLDEPALERLARKALGPRATVQPQHLAISDTRAIAIRMLSNLDAIYSSRGEHSHAMLVCDRLYELDGRPERVRDRGLHALALNAKESAIDDLRRYVELAPEASDVGRIRAVIDGAHKSPRSLN